MMTARSGRINVDGLRLCLTREASTTLSLREGFAKIENAMRCARSPTMRAPATMPGDNR